MQSNATDTRPTQHGAKSANDPRKKDKTEVQCHAGSKPTVMIFPPVHEDGNDRDVRG